MTWVEPKVLKRMAAEAAAAGAGEAEVEQDV